MNVASEQHQFDFSKVSHLFEGELGFVEETPRDYQVQILRDTVRDMSQGLIEGRWDIATAGGKSAMAHTLCEHIVTRGGKILYLTAGNNELRNAVRNHKKYGLGDNYLQVKGEEGVERLLGNKHPYTYATTQMLTYDERYKNIDPNYFDLIIVDESQDFFGDIFSLPLLYFNCPKIHASATPFTITQHLGQRVPHVYGAVTSKELEDKYNFPKKKIRNYHIQDFHDRDSQSSTGSDFDFESERSHRLLNIGRRFTLLEGIIEEVIQKGGKILPFMTSVRDAEDFVRFVVPSNPILRGRVDFTAGVRGRDKNDELEGKLRDGEIQALLSKDIINKALDVTDITDVAFTAPSLSLQKMIQRIGRAARPHPGKKSFTVHDMISSVFHSGKHQGKNKAIRTSQLHTLENDNKKKFLGKLSERQEYYDVVLPEGISDKEGFSYTEAEMGEVEHLVFLGDKEITRDIYAAFAREVFGVSYKELFDNLSVYRDHGETIMINWRDLELPITFQELMVASNFFGTFQYCKDYDYLGELHKALENGSDKKTTPLISQRNSYMGGDTETKIFTPSPEEQRLKTLETVLENIGVSIKDLGENNFQISFPKKLLQGFEYLIGDMSKNTTQKVKSILAGEILDNPPDNDEVVVQLSGKTDTETMILSFIPQLSDPYDAIISDTFIIEICQIISLHCKKKLSKDYIFKLNPRLGTRFLAMIGPNKSENLRDASFNIVRAAHESEAFLTCNHDIYYVMSHNGFVHAYKLVKDKDGNEYYLCLNDKAVEISELRATPSKSGITQTIRFFDTQGENAIDLGKMFPDIQKLVLIPGEKNPHNNKGSITLRKSGDSFIVGRVPLQVFDGDQVKLLGHAPHFFYPSK